MSGICGIVQFNGSKVCPKALRQMVVAAGHRGPDSSRCCLEGPVGLAHLALHLTSESERESQPLVSEQRDLVLTADAALIIVMSFVVS